MRKDVVNVGLIGCGTVGMGVVKILQKNIGILESKMGGRLRLVAACDQIKRSFPKGVHKIRFTRNWRALVEDPRIDIIIELVGGYEPARTMVLAALKAGKHVATANKALLAKYWGKVFSVARKSRTLVYFEAAVGGGIPVIQGLNEGLAANRIEKLYGILNGTTNYILGRMTGEGLDFASALKGAQEAGFAEADPTFDIEGLDAAHKLAILASLAGGTWVRLEHVYREGITDLDVWDLRFAQRELGLVTKLLGIVHFDKNGFSARVHPTLIPADHLFANVSREYNAIFVHGDAVGDVMFYGKGAGQMAAASAVVSDVVYLARQVASGTAGQIPYVTDDGEKRLWPIPFREVEYRHYLRFTTADKPGVLSQIAGLLAAQMVSIASLHQPDTAQFRISDFGSRNRGAKAKSTIRNAQSAMRRGVPIVVVTHRATEGAVQAVLKRINRLPVVSQKTVHLRIGDF